MSTTTIADQSMSFISGNFTHALATLAIEQRTEREKVALVEALLLSRMSGNSKKAEAKLDEFHRLRHNIIRDHWNKAIHQVMIRYNIPARVKVRKAQAESLQLASEQKGTDLQHKSSMRQQRKTDAQVRFNLEQNNQRPANVQHSNRRSISEGHMPMLTLSREAEGTPGHGRQQVRSCQRLMMPQCQSPFVPIPTSQSFMPICGLSSIPRGVQPAAWPGNAPFLQPATGQLHGSHTPHLSHDIASNGTGGSNCGVSRPMSGPFPSAASRLPTSSANRHELGTHWTTASSFSFPTESSQMSSIYAATKPGPAQHTTQTAVHRSSLSSCPTELSQMSSIRAATRPATARHNEGTGMVHTAGALMHGFQANHSVSCTDPAAAVSPGTVHHSSPPWHMTRAGTVTPSCTTEPSSAALDIDGHVDAISRSSAGQSRHQQPGRPLNMASGAPAGIARRSAAASGDVAGSEMTESSASGSCTQTHQRWGAQRGESLWSSRMHGGGTAGHMAPDATHLRHSHRPAYNPGHNSAGPVINGVQQAPGSQGAWGPSRQHLGCVAVPGGDRATTLQRSGVSAAMAMGVNGGSSERSYESSSRPSVGTPTTSGWPSGRQPAVRHAPGLRAEAGSNTHESGRMGGWCGQGGSRVGAPTKVAAGGAGSSRKHLQAGADAAPDGTLHDSSRQLHTAVAGIQHLGGIGAFRGASQGSETTESSEDEDD